MVARTSRPCSRSCLRAGSWTSRLPRIAAGVLACLLLLAPALARADGSSRARSTVNLGSIADEYYWALQDRLLRPDFSPRGNKGWVATLDGYARRLAHIKKANLDPQGRLTYRMLRDDLQRQRRYVTEGWLARDVNGTDSPVQTLVSFDTANFTTVNDWKWAIKTLGRSQRLMTSYIGVLREGLKDGRPQVREAVESAIRSLDVMTSNDRKANPFLAMEDQLARRMAGKPQLPALQAELERVVRDVVIPSHQELRRFLADEYLPRAGTLGADREAYLYAMDKHLGPDHPTPEQLNRWGRREVARLTRELERTARQIDPTMKSLPEFMARQSRQADNHFSGADELVIASRAEINRAREIVRAQVPVPRSEVSVEPVARYQEATVAAQYFLRSSGEGVMQVNTGPLLASQQRNELATLVTHEVYGGHHLAALYADKAADRLPTYRSAAANTAFDEGWGLYSEQLRDEQGEFTPRERVGYLVNHLWRAARLVVDTGMHTGTMSPAEARTYFQKATFLSRDATATEIQRYIDWPGQALAYYVGKRSFNAIRRRVKDILGKNYDPRAFHSKLLSMGSVPMEELEHEMTTWARRRAGQMGRRGLVRTLRTRKRAGRAARAGGASAGRRALERGAATRRLRESRRTAFKARARAPR